MADATRSASPAGLSDVPEEDSASVISSVGGRSPYGAHSALSSASTSTFHGGPPSNAPSRTPSLTSSAVANVANGTMPGAPRSPGPQGPRRPVPRADRERPHGQGHMSAPSIASSSSVTLTLTSAHNALGSEIERPASVAAHRGLVEHPSTVSLRKKGSDGTLSILEGSQKRSVRSRQYTPGSPAPERDGHGHRDASGNGPEGSGSKHKFRRYPHMPHDKDVSEVPATCMYWYLAPVHGLLPSRGWRAHTVNVVDNVAWIFGGCDDRGGWQDVWLFDTESFQWSHPEMTGDIPPPCRAHTSTLVDRKLVVYGGGQGAHYYTDVFVLDTVTRKWSKANFQGSKIPPPRRAHTAEYYRGKIYVFGGGNGSEAVNDVWTLDVGNHVNPDKMRWQKLDVKGPAPCARGYHTANIVGNVMVIVGGSDGKECFSDVWCFELDKLRWVSIKLEMPHRRLSHTSTQIGSYLYIFGGHDGQGYKNDLVLFNLTTLQYEHRPIHGRPPSLRGYHVAFLADSRLFFVGGFNGHDVYDDVHCIELAAASYLPQVTSFNIELEAASLHDLSGYKSKEVLKTGSKEVAK